MQNWEKDYKVMDKIPIIVGTLVSTHAGQYFVLAKYCFSSQTWSFSMYVEFSFLLKISSMISKAIKVLNHDQFEFKRSLGKVIY